MKKIKVGRNKNIQTPELMYKYFKDYVKETKSNPFFIKDWVGKVSNQIKLKEKKKNL